MRSHGIARAVGRRRPPAVNVKTVRKTKSMCRYGCRSEGLGTSDPSLAVAEGFPCSVAGLMAVPLSLVTHDTRAYAQMPLANHSLERERPSTAQAAALSDQHIPTGICTQRVTGRGPAPKEYSTAFIFKGRQGTPSAAYGFCFFHHAMHGKIHKKPRRPGSE